MGMTIVEDAWKREIDALKAEVLTEARHKREAEIAELKAYIARYGELIAPLFDVPQLFIAL